MMGNSLSIHRPIRQSMEYNTEKEAPQDMTEHPSMLLPKPNNLQNAESGRKVEAESANMPGSLSSPKLLCSLKTVQLSDRRSFYKHWFYGT